VFVASKWGSEGAGLVTLVLAVLAAPCIAPTGARPAFEDSALVVFILGGIVGNRLIGSQVRLERRLQASEAQVRTS